MIKHAALFYDTIVPFPFEATTAERSKAYSSFGVVRDIWKVIPEDLFNELLGPVARIMANPDALPSMAGHRFAAMFKILLCTYYMYSQNLAHPPSSTDAPDNRADSRPAEAPGYSWMSAEFIRLGLEPVFLLPEKILREGTAVADDITLTLRNVQLIDTSTASWEQIREIRRDELRSSKLRNLRLFWQSNYTGKSQAFIEDDLRKRLDEYHEAAKDHGFQMAISTLTTVADSKTLLPFAAAAFGATILHEPMAAAGALISGASLELAKISLDLAKRRHAFSRFKKSFDLSYVMDVQQVLKP